MKKLFLIFLFLAGCIPHYKPEGLDPEAKYILASNNYSHWDIYINEYILPPNVTIFFFDDILENTFGIFCPIIKYVQDGKKYTVRNVIIIDVLDCIIKEVSLTLVLSHELVHFQQCINLGAQRFEYEYQTNKEILEVDAYTKQYESPIIIYAGKYRTPIPHHITELSSE